MRAIERIAPAGAAARWRFGIVVAAVLPTVVGWSAMRLIGRGGVRGLVGGAIALDLAFALRTLLGRAAEVRAALDRNDVDQARALLAMHLVSRDTSDLAPGEIAGATIESVAENLSDGVIAPWLWFAAAGAPGALAYRTVNTLDSMWGYRTAPYAELGYGAAHLDDIANLIPARVTAAAICAAAFAGGHAGSAIETWRRDGDATESPNAGHPMAAMAGALGVTLTKRGAYRLGSGREPGPEDITAAIAIARRAAVVAGGALLFAMLASEARA